MVAKVVYIKGGTGFVGRSLCAALLREPLVNEGDNNTKAPLPQTNDYKIYVQTRMPSHHRHRSIQFVSSYQDLPDAVEPDVLINLAGAPIADKRWSDAQKKILLDSRVRNTENFLRSVKQRNHSPKVLINASAIGYYGVRGNEELNESDTRGHGFASDLCAAWENAALQFEQLGTRVCIFRIGVVLGRGGGALSKILPLFRLGMGGPIAGGKQWFSWIHIYDLVRLITTAVDNEEYTGVFNGTAPNPVLQAEFARALGKALNRPACMPTPGLALKLFLGQMADELLIGGQRVMPTRALQRAFQFQHTHVQSALLDITKSCL